MSQRVPLNKVAPPVLEALLAIERHLESSGLEPRLLHLLRLRASQVNGCSYCIDMHSRDARLAGEPERRVLNVAGYEESPLYDAREKAALAWAETLTRVSETHAPDAAWERLRAFFDEKQAVELTLAVGMINLWNRAAIGLRVEPPSHWPKLPPG